VAGKRLGFAVLLCGILAVMCAAAAWGLGGLPPSGRVNEDAAAGIDPTQSVGGEDPTNADVVGGALTAGKPAVPWAVFRQQEASGGHDQIFSRSFAGGSWTTRGNGTVGGRSSASPAFSGSLNFDQGKDGEAPSIDFAGTGRAVPWATWYEATEGAGFADENNIFASRFDSAQGKWIFAGQGRGTGGIGSVAVPSLNIHTEEDAENPSVAGGSAVDPTKPGPWVTWQETTSAPTPGADQIFVERPLGPGQANCDGVKPLGMEDGSGHVPAIGGFCWQQTGIPRVGPGGADPSLNVDPTRNGIEPDIAFTGANDGVPWVVWYEKGPSELGLKANEMVFAAKGVKDEVKENGGFHWVAVGKFESGTLDTSGASKFGACSASTNAEASCALNHSFESNAEDPQVAAGTMDSTKPTAPWVAWDEESEGLKQIFVARLVEGSHFQIVNNGSPISSGPDNSTRPDITFSGNTPYVSWRREVGGGAAEGVTGHFVNAAEPKFVLDSNKIPLTPTAQADVREPISSTCTANPFNGDGTSCQGGALGTPFLLFTNGTAPRGLFADAYTPEGAVVTNAASSITTSSASVGGAVNPDGAPLSVFFEYGATTGYGQTTAIQRIAGSNSAVGFSASLTGLPAGTTIHYRAVAVSDFASFPGGDQTLTTAPGPTSGSPPAATVSHVVVSGTAMSARVTCSGPPGGTCKLTVKLAVTELLRNNRLVSVTARAKLKRKVVVLGAATIELKVGETKTLRVGLNGAGKSLLARRHVLKVRVEVSGVPAGQSTSGLPRTLTFKAPKHKHRR
jgi:hypothetical protein